ncbi:MAG TPA: serine/threonine-protein kinase [Kofleriaceae bacterium]
MLHVVPQRTRHLGPGDKLGKYEVIRQIAIGGMAELYLARTLGIEGFEKLVVLKRILPQYGSNETFVNMFLNEARLAATLHHPNVAQVYDIGLEDGDYFFAMEYVHGEDLDHIHIAAEEQGVPLSMDAALTLVAGLCSGLHYAHEKMNAEGKPLNIVHRDVSPSNVLVSYDGAVKLVDFGIARASSRPGTTHGGLKGKISYMSPEQCRAKAQLDRRSDLYSVGTILYELTTGQLPFSGETEYQVLNQIVNEDVPPPSSVVPDYPAHLEQIVLKALARDVDQRYTTALQLQADVEDFAHETRFRISPLVLARLMGSLFPARLEEWDHAKTQGAFFLEQHVVRTLIESGKAGDDGDPLTQPELVAHSAAQARQNAAAKAAALALKHFGDDDTTALSQSSYDAADTAVGDPALHESTLERGPSFDRSEPTVPERPEQNLYDHSSVDIPSPPEPRPPQQYPVVSALMSASPGSLVTSAGKYGGLPANDVTQTAVGINQHTRDPQRRHPSATAFVRARARTSLYAIIGVAAVAGLIIAVIALRGDDKSAPPAAAPAAVEMKAEPTPGVEQAHVEPTPVAPTPIEPPPVEPPPAAKPAPAVKPAKKVEIAKPAPPAKNVAVKKPEPAKKPAPMKPAPSTPKETSWNADSPFMPVRTEKK